MKIKIKKKERWENIVFEDMVYYGFEQYFSF